MQANNAATSADVPFVPGNSGSLLAADTVQPVDDKAVSLRNTENMAGVAGVAIGVFPFTEVMFSTDEHLVIPGYSAADIFRERIEIFVKRRITYIHGGSYLASLA